MNIVHIIFLFPIVTPPLTWLFQLEHVHVYNKRGFSIGTPIYLNAVHIIFFAPFVTPSLTWFFYWNTAISGTLTRILLHLFEGEVSSNMYIRTEPSELFVGVDYLE